MAKITALNVNGKKLQVDVDSETSLLSVLRNDLSLTGSKHGCGEGLCGACTVLIEGQPARSCVTEVGRVEAIEFENGKILNARFSRYHVPRFMDVPAIEVALVDRKDLPSAGAGETPIVGLAPAVGNAIFDATGVRLRSLPLVPKGLIQTAKCLHYSTSRTSP